MARHQRYNSPMARRPLDLMKAVEHEIAGEKAFSLGRAGAQLDELLAELRRLADDAERTAGETRAAIVSEFNRTRRKAEDVYYALMLQREAMGAKHHDMLAVMYPIPPKLK